MTLVITIKFYATVGITETDP